MGGSSVIRWEKTRDSPPLVQSENKVPGVVARTFDYFSAEKAYWSFGLYLSDFIHRFTLTEV